MSVPIGLVVDLAKKVSAGRMSSDEARRIVDLADDGRASSDVDWDEVLDAMNRAGVNIEETRAI